MPNETNETRECGCSIRRETCNCAQCENCRQWHPYGRPECSCYLCEGCDQWYENGSPDCDCYQCEGCNRWCNPDNPCERCYYCIGCAGTVSRDFCSDCERCGECCECSQQESRIERIRPRATPKFWTGKPCAENPSTRYISLEIEISGNEENTGTTYNVMSKWGGAIVDDGSLPDSGSEINTAPASGHKLIEQILDISDALSVEMAQTDKSCGLHVHADARDFSYYDIRRLILLWSKIESTLYEMIPPSRRGSSYCAPCAEKYLDAILGSTAPKESKHNILRKLYGKPDTRDVRDDKYNGARYYALNLHSWLYRGTVECRLMSGGISRKKLQNWSILWAAIVDYAYRHTEREIAMLDVGRETLLAIAPSTACREWVKNRLEMF